MLKFFRKIRNQSLSSGQVKRYLLYAFGEIFLVLVGILLALQVNAWNEHRKDQKEIQEILEVINNELEADLKTTEQIQIACHNKLILIDSVVNKLIPDERLYHCFPCITMHTFVTKFTPNHNGYDMLKAIVKDSNLKKDTLISDILTFYSKIIERSTYVNLLVEENTLENLKYLRDQFEDSSQLFLNQKIEEPLVDAMMADYRVKNQMAFHQIVLSFNMVPLLKGFKSEGKRLHEQIKTHLSHK